MGEQVTKREYFQVITRKNQEQWYEWVDGKAVRRPHYNVRLQFNLGMAIEVPDPRKH